jgi:hypothetical protein
MARRDDDVYWHGRPEDPQPEPEPKRDPGCSWILLLLLVGFALVAVAGRIWGTK